MDGMLFRGKRIEDDEWMEACNVTYCNDNNHPILRCYIQKKGSINIYAEDGETTIGTCFVDIDSVGRFTEMVDVDFNRIFEGDLVYDTKHYGNGLGLVVFYKGSFNVWWKDGGGLLFGFDNLKVAGNKTDNPELVPEGATEERD